MLKNLERIISISEIKRRDRNNSIKEGYMTTGAW